MPSFDVTRADGSLEYLISPPTCIGGLCVDIFAEGLCSCRVPMYIFPPDAVMLNKESKIGGFVKVWGGLGLELFTDADKFEVPSPPHPSLPLRMPSSVLCPPMLSRDARHGHSFRARPVIAPRMAYICRS